jgi:sterol desaturase/sphingolipid hydroxylase (fatty acid hydroxylase superfamily)
MGIILTLLMIAVGHLAGAYSFYFFHRHIFHGKLGKLPILKSWKRIHTNHHADPKDPGNFFFPMWANIIIWTFSASLIFINWPFAAGLFSFFILYAYRHRKAHEGTQSRWAHHHMSHHNSYPKANFSGTYPFLDKVLGTYRLVPARVKKDKHPNNWQR